LAATGPDDSGPLCFLFPLTTVLWLLSILGNLGTGFAFTEPPSDPPDWKPEKLPDR
jgi:hypothetical protein